MKKVEFVEQLQRALAANLRSEVVAEHVRYYNEYIETAVRKGESEEDVVASLGEPRLLAKSIVDAAKASERKVGSEYEAEQDETQQNTEYQKRWKIPGWLLFFAGIVIVVLVIGLLTSLLSLLLPILIPILCILLIINYFKK